jgi:hypothetical protein
LPVLRLRIAPSTSFDALREYFRAMVHPPIGGVVVGPRHQTTTYIALRRIVIRNSRTRVAPLFLRQRG